MVMWVLVYEFGGKISFASASLKANHGSKFRINASKSGFGLFVARLVKKMH